MQKKSKYKYKFLIVCLSFVFILRSIIPVYSASLNWTGSGTEANPYIISSVQGLTDLATSVNNGNSYQGKYFKLGSNIDLSAISSWTPIGYNYYAPFSGTFDGGHYVISNMSFSYLYVNYDSYFGLFGNTDGAEIKNTVLLNTNFYCQVKGKDTVVYYGSIVGACSDTLIYNCGVSYGSITTDKEDTHSFAAVGGLVGYLSYDSYVINSYNNSNIAYHNGVRDNFYYGGIAGYNDGTVYNCYNTSKITCYNGDWIKAEQDPISGNHAQDYPNYYDATVYGTYNRNDISIPLTTDYMQSSSFKNDLNDNKDNLPTNFPVTSDELDTWAVEPSEYPLPCLPSTTVPFFLDFSSVIGINKNGEVKGQVLNDFTSQMVPVTLSSVGVSSALSGLLSNGVPTQGSGKLALSMRYNGTDIFLTNGMTVGQTIISSPTSSPTIQFVYYVDSKMVTLLNKEPVTVTLKSVSNNIITYYTFTVSITTSNLSATGQAFYDRGRHYDGISASTQNPLKADSCFTVQFLTSYNPSLAGDASSRRIILQSGNPFPAKTKFTLIDKTNAGTPKYYYYTNVGALSSINLTSFKTMGTANGQCYSPPTYNEEKQENLIIVVDYSMTDGTSLSSEIYLRHTINNSESDMLSEIPKVHTYIGSDAPSISISGTNFNIGNKDNLTFSINVTGAHTKTIYDEQKYSVVLESSIPLPYGSKVKMSDTYYNITDSNKKVILPVEAEGTYNITIEPSENGFLASFTLTANLYSAPNSGYPYTTEFIIASAAQNVIVQQSGDHAIKASVSDEQMLIKEGSSNPINFRINVIDSDAFNKVKITLYKKKADNGFEYTNVSAPVYVSVPQPSNSWSYTSSLSWEKGIYRFTFELLGSSDNTLKTTNVNIICY